MNTDESDWVSSTETLKPHVVCSTTLYFSANPLGV
jgi:hypothetical protein